MSSERSDQLCWYVVRTHPKQEDRAEKNLRAWKVETLCPKIKERRFNPFIDDPIYAIKPLFPRYIFVRFRISDLYHKVRYTRGVSSLISFNDYPSAIDGDIIEAIQSRIAKDGFVTVGERFNPGDEVMIRKGPLQGFIGVFEREMTGADRVRILLQTVSYQSHVVVSRDMITKPDISLDAAYRDGWQ